MQSPELGEVRRISDPSQAFSWAKQFRSPAHTLDFPELNKERKALGVLEKPACQVPWVVLPEIWGDNRIPDPLNPRAACPAFGKAGYWKRGLAWPLSLAARTASVQWANAFMCLEWADYGNYDRACFPITGSMFSRHLTLLVPNAARREERTCLPFYGGNTEKALKNTEECLLVCLFVSALVIYPLSSSILLIT